MAMLVSILGLWANKNTFINRNGTSGEMLDSLDARDISLRLEDQGVHTFHNPAHLQYCQGEVLASTQFYGNESLHSNSTIGMSVFERSVEAPFVALFALWIFVVMPVLLSDIFFLPHSEAFSGVSSRSHRSRLPKLRMLFIQFAVRI